MTDILALFEQCKDMVAEFLGMSIDFDLSWGQRSDFDTGDPFDNVRVREDKVVIRDTIANDPIWIIDAIRGLIMAALSSNRTALWNFVTLISLIMIPSTLIPDSRKTTYRKQWLEYKKYFEKKSIRYNYERWYKHLNAYNRKQTLQVLSDFIKQANLEGNIETQFNAYLLNMLRSLYNEDDINFIHYGLKLQSLDRQDIRDQLGWSSSKFYRVKSRLDYVINEYYVPNYPQLNLGLLYFPASNQDQLEKYRQFPYYENFENFVNSNHILYKFYIPSSAFRRILAGMNPKELRSSFMIRQQATLEVFASPLMYNTSRKQWDSVFETKKEVVSLPYNVSPAENVNLTQSDLQVLLGVLRNRSTNERTLGLELSQSVTKKSIRKLEKYNLFGRSILWRRPSDLNTIGVIIPIAGFKEYESSVLNSEFSSIENIISTIKTYSWPFLTLEQCIEFDTDGQKLICRPVLFTRISGLDTDLLQFASRLENKEIIGMYERPPGSIVVIPYTYFSRDWIFDVDEFLDLVEFYG